MMRSTESLMSLVVFDRLYHLPTLYYRMRSTESLESLVVFGRRLYHLQP